jgi:photosystem II stability/assembly factor-like uncharacterized protein
MKSVTRLSFIAALSAGLVFIGAGCISFGPPTASQGADGGIFKSADKGETWTLKSSIPTVTGEKRSFSGASVGLIAQDPQDTNAIYVGTAENGMFYSYDSGESWFQPMALARGRVWSIAVHPKDKCTVFATFENKLVKTDDCSRTWTVPYLDSRVGIITKAVAIDSYNSNNVWLGLSSGDLLVSQDGGASWSNNHGFGNDIVRVIVNPADTRRLLVVTAKAGIWRTDDAGANWKDLSQNYTSFSGSKEFLDIAIGVADPKLVVFASKFGLIRSRDYGDTWEKIDLLTPPGQSLIYSLAIDPKDNNVIYYGTATTFNKTSNGGTNWITKRLPTSRVASVLQVDRANSNVIWMGATKLSN